MEHDMHHLDVTPLTLEQAETLKGMKSPYNCSRHTKNELRRMLRRDGMPWEEGREILDRIGIRFEEEAMGLPGYGARRLP